MKPGLSPEAPAPVKIGEALEELNRQIHENQLSRKTVAGWAGNFLGAAIGLGLIVILTPIKIPLLAAGAVLSLIGYGVTKLIKQSLDDGIVEKQKKREELLVSHEAALTGPAPQPAPQKTPKISAAYNSSSKAEADRIEALEKRVRQLQDEIEGKPVVLDKPKSIISRLGFG